MNDELARERELVRRCRAGSEAAYAEFIASRSRLLFSLAVRLAGSPAVAEDVVTATFVEAFRAIERGDERLPLTAWLAGLCVRHARRRVGSGALPARRGLLAGQVRHDVAGSTIAGALSGLPFEARAALLLRFTLGLSAADAAFGLGVAPSAFGACLARGLADLRAQIERPGERVALARPESRPQTALRRGVAFDPRISAGGRD